MNHDYLEQKLRNAKESLNDCLQETQARNKIVTETWLTSYFDVKKYCSEGGIHKYKASIAACPEVDDYFEIRFNYLRNARAEDHLVVFLGGILLKKDLTCQHIIDLVEIFGINFPVAKPSHGNPYML